MRIQAGALLVGAFMAASVGLQAPMAQAATTAVTQTQQQHVPNNNPSKALTSHVNSALSHVRQAFGSAAQAQVDVIQGKFADAANDIKATRQHLNAAQQTGKLPEDLSRTIARLNSHIPAVERAIQQQSSSARRETENLVAMMSHDLGNLRLATTSPTGGGAGPVKKKTTVKKTEIHRTNK